MGKIILSILLVIPLFLATSYQVVKGIQFDRNVGGHLKRAADSNTIDLAKKELEVAIKFLEENNMTKGYTSVIYTTPDEDVEFWYNNLKSSLIELESLGDNVSPLERSNMLIKLRETLLDTGEKGSTKITAPSGISIFPYNTLICLLMIICAILAIPAAILLIIVFGDN